jgi:predicted ABC-type ATPase/phosphopantetheine adenylyltransferase
MKKFFLVIGGPGAGKNHYIEYHIPRPTKLVDIDAIKSETNTEEAISAIKDILINELKSGHEIIAHPTLGKNTTANVNKLKAAKHFGYHTVLVLIKNQADQASKNIKKRIQKGGHSAPDNIDEIFQRVDQSFNLTKQVGNEWIDEIIEFDSYASQKSTFESFFNRKKTLLNESDMLDISILNIDKAQKRILSLIDVPVTVTEKSDGVKITVVRNSKDFSSDWKDNWIVAYKGSVIHPEDFVGMDSQAERQTFSSSIGITQFKKIFNVLEEAQKTGSNKNIPKNTELFFEFLMRKPTLTRTYNTYHELILIASSPTSYKESFGRLTTAPTTFETKTRNEYADALNVQIPNVLFKGKLNELVNSVVPEEIIKQLKDKFLSLESSFGGKMEGVVLEFENGTFIKILQEDQHDKQTRSKIKDLYAPKDPEKYYSEIRKIANSALESIKPIKDIKTSLSNLSKWIFNNSSTMPLFSDLDPNKTEINAKDDVFLTAKMLLLRKLPGNNNALFLGRFSPLTKAHYKIIDQAIKQYDHVTVNIVKAKQDERNPFPIELQKTMLQLCFGNKIEVTVSETGNLVRVLQKPSKTINVVLAGTDRSNNYKDQLKVNAPDVTVVEIPRVDEISGTVVRDSLKNNDVSLFKQNTPQEIWSMYEELRKFV